MSKMERHSVFDWSWDSAFVPAGGYGKAYQHYLSQAPRRSLAMRGRWPFGWRTHQREQATRHTNEHDGYFLALALDSVRRGIGWTASSVDNWAR